MTAAQKANAAAITRQTEVTLGSLSPWPSPPLCLPWTLPPCAHRPRGSPPRCLLGILGPSLGPWDLGLPWASCAFLGVPWVPGFLGPGLLRPDLWVQRPQEPISQIQTLIEQLKQPMIATSNSLNVTIIKQTGATLGSLGLGPSPSPEPSPNPSPLVPFVP